MDSSNQAGGRKIKTAMDSPSFTTPTAPVPIGRPVRRRPGPASGGRPPIPPTLVPGNTRRPGPESGARPVMMPPTHPGRPNGDGSDNDSRLPPSGVFSVKGGPLLTDDDSNSATEPVRPRLGPGPGSRPQIPPTPVPGRLSGNGSNVKSCQPVPGLSGTKKRSTPLFTDDDRVGSAPSGRSSSNTQDKGRGSGRMISSGDSLAPFTSHSFAPSTPQNPSASHMGIQKGNHNGPQTGTPSAPRNMTGMTKTRPSSQSAAEPSSNDTANISLPIANTLLPAEKSTVVPSAYPQFADADVRITSPTGKVFKLHATVLSKASSVIAMSLSATAPLSGKNKLKDDKGIKWDIMMVADRRARDIDRQGMNYMSFDKINVKDKGLSMLPNYNGLGEEPGFDQLYDNLFRCMYNLEPNFIQDSNQLGSDLVGDAIQLLQAAMYLEAVPCVRFTIEARLMRLNQMLWKHIGNSPQGWIHIAAQLESPLIFREALIHLVGKFHLKNGIDEEFLRRKVHGPLTERVWSLIVQKAAELKDKKLRVERVLLEFYPTRMTHKEGPDDLPGRNVYASDIYFWQAVTVFRQFIASAYLSNYHHKAEDGGLAFYREIGAENPTYLRPETFVKFHQMFDMSSKGKGLLLNTIKHFKDEARPVVSELLRDRSQLIRGPNDPLPDHLTCTEILDQEMPWILPGGGLGDRQGRAGGMGSRD